MEQEDDGRERTMSIGGAQLAQCHLLNVLKIVIMWKVSFFVVVRHPQAPKPLILPFKALFQFQAGARKDKSKDWGFQLGGA